MKERRRDPRYHSPEKFQVKARVKKQTEGEVFYYSICDLSMGGICFVADSEKALEMSAGDLLDILIYRKNLSVRVTAEIIVDEAASNENEKKLRAKIVGISDFGREVLASFLKEMAIQE